MNFEDSLVPSSVEKSSAGISAGDDSEVELTPGEVLEELQQAWTNEKFAPELLPHKFEIADCVVDQLHAMEENLAKSKSGNTLRNHIHRIELDRIRYVLCSYLRTRLEKIEKYVFFCLKDEEKRKKDGLNGKMSEEERKFALEFRSSLEKHLQDSVLDKLPSNVRKLDFDKVAPKPSLEEYVFLKVKRDVPNPASDVGDSEWKSGSQHLISYKYVKDLLENGDISLM